VREMLFECQKCKERFHYPAKLITLGMPQDDLKMLSAFIAEAPKDSELIPLIDIFTNLKKAFDMASLERCVCPFCQSKTFAEYIEPTVTEQTVNVLVIDLTTGPQLQVDRALADGYKIVNRYAKSYVLEKSAKPTVTQP
jgi:hypothetical protein